MLAAKIQNLKYHYLVRKYSLLGLNSRLLNQNFLYRYALNRKIRKTHCNKSNKPEVAIEITNSCNAKCSFCAHHLMKRPTGNMSIQLFSKIIQDMSENGYNCLNLTGFGESLLHKDLCTFITEAKMKNISIKVFTNASLLSRKLSICLLNAGLDEITFSLDTVDESEFNRVRKGLTLEKVTRNMDNFIKLKKSYNSPIVTTIQATVYDGTFNEVKAVYKKYKDKVDNITFQSAFNWAGSQPHYQGPLAARLFNKRIPCQLLWCNLAVRWNGDVSLCCMDYDSHIILGNLNHHNLDDILNSDLLNRYKEKHLNGHMNSLKLCEQCDLLPIWW